MEADSFQESVEAQSNIHNIEETENDSGASLEVFKKQTDVRVDSMSMAVKIKTSEEVERTETEYDETRLITDQHSVDIEERYSASTKDISEERELQKQHEDSVSDGTSSDTGTSRYFPLSLLDVFISRDF